MKKFYLDPNWVTGFTDAEGNFSININQKSGKIGVSFKLSQNYGSRDVLLALKEFFQCGEVYPENKEYSAYKFQVSDKFSLNHKILPHFYKYPLVTSK